MNELLYLRDTDPYVSPKGGRRRMAYYRCYCGKEFVTSPQRVKSGNTRSCGCFHKSELSKRQKKHGLSDTPIYKVWTNMMRRCYNPSWRNFKRYGGRGINVCERWQIFENFYEDNMPFYEKLLTIDRIDNDKGYYPDNVRWVTMAVNSTNKHTSKRVEYNGEQGNVTPMSRELGLYSANVLYHMRKGLTFQQAADYLLKRKQAKP